MIWTRSMSVICLSVVLVLATGIEVSTAQNVWAPAPERFFRVDVGPGQPWRGKDSISGWVYNDYGFPATNVKISVDSVDGAGAVVGRTAVSVDGIIPPFGRAYFASPVSSPGVVYVGTVVFYEYFKGGGGQ